MESNESRKMIEEYLKIELPLGSSIHTLASKVGGAIDDIKRLGADPLATEVFLSSYRPPAITVYYHREESDEEAKGRLMALLLSGEERLRLKEIRDRMDLRRMVRQYGVPEGLDVDGLDE